MSGHLWTRTAAIQKAPETAREHAQQLIDELGLDCRVPPVRVSEPAIAWAASGAMALTGESEGPPRLAPDGIARSAQGAILALDTLTGCAPTDTRFDAVALLSERAAHFGGHRRGRTSVGGGCRLVATQDGWIAVNLARADDRDLLPAWLGESAPADPWSTVCHCAAKTRTEALVDRGRLLGLPVAPAGSTIASPRWRRVLGRGDPVSLDRGATPSVVDLSALWAGPLCTQLLLRGGAQIVKVESLGRPDGARRGAVGFFDLLNAGKASVALDFGTAEGRLQLARLIDRTDIVIESARPRALAQLGIDAAAWVQARPGRTWVGITGYGREEPESNWVAFGDDAAVAAGLADAVGDADGPLFCGDAIADPLTGLHAAVAALGSYRSGGGELIDVNLRDVAAFALQQGPDRPGDACIVPVGNTDRWELVYGRERVPVAAPHSRPTAGRARALGADTAAVIDRLDHSC